MSEAIAALDAAANELMSSKLMTAGLSVKNLLRCIAYFPELRKAAESAVKGFDYPRAYSRALANLGTHTTFKMPENPKKQAALGICLFTEFDLHKRDFMKFVMDFFPRENRGESYSAFLNAVAAPFIKSFKYVLEGGLAVKEEEIKAEAAAVAVSQGIAEQSKYIISVITETVKGASLEAAEREECQTVIDGFSLAVDTRDPILLKVVWIGLKNTMTKFRLCHKQIKELETLLNAYKSL
ncbi:MAG TPA: hypothetical protein P5161_06105 [Eubacteriales bacterium]|nr:hypothetical protein [Eubacteriales bacterium]HRU83807.1 hypothetical protein [Eubacteriales bacterium]